MGRPIKYSDEERKKSLTQSKTKYMLNKEWRCKACNDRNYTMAGKHTHIRTKKHIYNHIIMTLKADNDIDLISKDQIYINI